MHSDREDEASSSLSALVLLVAREGEKTEPPLTVCSITQPVSQCEQAQLSLLSPAARGLLMVTF